MGKTLHELEEALQLLRRQEMDAWGQYLLGAVPFLLAVLAFARDMTSGYAAERCLLESLLCALVFFWSLAWKARFAGTLFAVMADEQRPFKRSGFSTCLFAQAILQALKLVVMPIAVFSVVPLAAAATFFRSATIEADRPGCTLKSVVRRSANHASRSLRSVWLALALLLILAGVIFVNVFAMVLLLPHLTKIFTGYENEWTRRSIFTFNLFAAALGLTWLAIDPLMQAYFVVRCFYSEARTNGRDLLIRLGHLAALLLVICAASPAHSVPNLLSNRPATPARGLGDFSSVLTKRRLAAGLASRTGTSGAGQETRLTISRSELDRGITSALRNEEFGWQRAKKISNESNSFLDRISHDVSSAISALRDWILKLIIKNREAEKEPQRRAPRGAIQWWMYSIGAVIVFAMLLALFRMRSSSAPPVQPEIGSDPKQPDLTNDQVLASDVPDSEWLRLAREYIDSGNLRLAVRALYLSNLAYLGARQLIAIAKSKSNGVYERELYLRARGNAVTAAFAMTNRGYERAWYGCHEVTPELLEAFEHHMEVIRQYA